MVLVDMLINTKKQKSFCCNLFLCSLLFSLTALDYLSIGYHCQRLCHIILPHRLRLQCCWVYISTYAHLFNDITFVYCVVVCISKHIMILFNDTTYVYSVVGCISRLYPDTEWRSWLPQILTRGLPHSCTSL